MCAIKTSIMLVYGLSLGLPGGGGNLKFRILSQNFVGVWKLSGDLSWLGFVFPLSLLISICNEASTTGYFCICLYKQKLGFSLYWNQNSALEEGVFTACKLHSV